MDQLRLAGRHFQLTRSTSDSDATGHASTDNGQAVQAPRAEIAQKSRFSECTPSALRPVSLLRKDRSGNKMLIFAR